MIKIGIDAHGIGGSSLGFGNTTYFYNLIRSLLEIDNENEYHLFVKDPAALSHLSQKHPNVRLVALWPSTQWLQRSLSAPLYALQKKLDVVHFPFILPPVLSCRSIVTVHDICFEEYPEFYPFIDRLRMQLLVRKSCHRADHILTVSQFSKEQICRNYNIDDRKISVTYNAGEHLLNARTKPSADDLKDWPEKFIFYVGLIQPRKNLPRLVKAFDQMISRTNLTHHLVLGGKWGWKNEELTEALNSAEYGHRIHLKGYLPDETVQAAMEKADLFAFPSLFEGFGIPPMEAQSCGTPALVSNTTCFPEIYADSVQYCDPYSINSITENMTRALTDQNLKTRLIEAGHKRLSCFSWKSAARTALNQYIGTLS